jgi:hypothetical protein
MCSMNGGQLGRICRAIDELAADSASADRGDGESAPAASEDGTAQEGAAHRDGAADRDGAARRAGRDDADIARLAAIWEMVADADPELAKRLPGYLSAAE